MNNKDYAALIENDFHAYIKRLRVEKEAEYAHDTDTLRNFRNVSPICGLSPAHYCMVLLMKHMGGIVNQIVRGDWTWEYRLPNGGEGLKQRLADASNYIDLAFALLHEEAQKR